MLSDVENVAGAERMGETGNDTGVSAEVVLGSGGFDARSEGVDADALGVANTADAGAVDARAASGAAERAYDRLKQPAGSARGVQSNPYLRAENEDDDGYDPYSDRRPEPEPLFERDPWG